MTPMHARIVGGLIAVVIAGGLLGFVTRHPPSSRSISSSSGPSPSRVYPAAKSIAPPPSSSPTQSTAGFVYPLPNYNQRLTVRTFGTYVTAADRAKLPCGTAYVGYHDGDDLEILSGELTEPVPVHAIAAGIVRQVGPVTGYGGLIVIQHNLAGKTVTANYGHIDLTTATVKAGDSVTAGQIIADLASQCTAASGGERKHLHFALHRGSVVDVAGYVPTTADLANWLNPHEALAALHAVSPSG